MTYLKGFIAAIAAAFVVIAYTLAVLMLKHKAIGVGVFVGYFTRPLFWVTLIVTSIYAYVITVEH